MMPSQGLGVSEWVGSRTSDECPVLQPVCWPGGPLRVKEQVCFTDLSLSDQVSLLSSFMLITETEPGSIEKKYI